MRKSLILLLGILLLVFPLLFLGCEGDDGPRGAKGDQGDPGDPGDPGQDATAAIEPESCTICHTDEGNSERNGAGHQAYYNELYQDGVIKVANVEFAHPAANQYVTTFNMTTGPDDDPYDCTEADSVGAYFTMYVPGADPGVGTFEMADGARFSLSPSTPPDEVLPVTERTYDAGTNLCTLTATYAADVDDYTTTPGILVVYGYEGSAAYRISRSGQDRVRQVNFPFAGLTKIEPDVAVDYVSAANNDGCSLCHTDPYLKHGYIYAQVDRDATTDFYTCKACHLDNGGGGHFEWQLAVDDPQLWARYAKDLTTVEENDDIADKYAYRTRLMNDVHMSHAMEFPYPQSMRNCATCHQGKFAQIFDNRNMVLETCKSCHPVDGGTDLPDTEGEYRFDFRPIALNTIVPHELPDPTVQECNDCHLVGGIAPGFQEIHSGYDPVIYDSDGAKYAGKVTVGPIGADYDAGTGILTITFNASAATENETTLSIPSVSISVYAYGTKEFFYGSIGAADAGSVPPAYTYTANVGTSDFADEIAAGHTKVEIVIRPRLEDADDTRLAINGVSTTFDLAANDVVDSPADLVDVNKCRACHDALATTFHTTDSARGGSVTICRTCHVPGRAGGHLEMQSRSIVSYVHAIHSFQEFDIDEIDFADPVEALHYEDHTELFPFPKHGIEDCESCHNPGTYYIADQANSLPGLLSNSTPGVDREMGNIPQYVVGPNSKACGSCHRVEWIVEDDPSSLTAFNSHTRVFGYLVKVDPPAEGGTAQVAAWLPVADEIMAYFWP